MKIRVKPANDEHRVPLPDGRYVTKEGMTVEVTPFVQWLLDQKDLVIDADAKKTAAEAKANATPEPAAPAAPAAKEG